ncbi:hypothetical protein QW180_28225 [Vibrio sinaloensis]|nr:hypothetical protein [Vibrio sinaloensis]
MKREQLIDAFNAIVGRENVITDQVKNKYYRSGFRSGGGSALAVVFFLIRSLSSGKSFSNVLKLTALLLCKRQKKRALLKDLLLAVMTMTVMS